MSNRIIFLTLCIAAAITASEMSASQYAKSLSIEISILFFGGFGVFVASAEAARIYPQNQYKVESNKLQNFFVFITLQARSKFEYISNIAGNFADKDTEEAKSYALGAEHIQKITEFLNRRGRNAPAKLDTILRTIPEEITDEHVIDVLKSLLKHFETYDEMSDHVSHLKEHADGGMFGDALVLFAPYFISIAIGLSLFRSLSAGH